MIYTGSRPSKIVAAASEGVPARTLEEDNPIVEMVLGSLNLAHEERGVIQQALEKMVRERASGSAAAELTNPINIGVGTK